MVEFIVRTVQTTILVEIGAECNLRDQSVHLFLVIRDFELMVRVLLTQPLVKHFQGAPRHRCDTTVVLRHL
jgi:hypothetical protein